MKVVLPEGPDTLIKSRAYTFDLASQVTSVVDGGITTNYAYDLAGQLTSEVKSSGYSASYSYDANGNRLSRTVNDVTESYSYDAGDKLLAVTGGVDPRSFVYDAAGRTTSIQRASGNTNFTYDYESRVTSITKPGTVTNLMSYNGLGTRVGLTDSGGSKQYMRDGVGVTSPVLSDGNSTFTAGGERTNGVSKTLHSGLKNDDLQTNASGSVIGERLYDAFGNVVSNSGAWSSHSGYGGKFGYQDDADSSLKLLGHRYYDSSTGRFLTRDPIKDGRNWYVYCDNNPVSRSDPKGLDYHDPVRVEVDPEFEGKVWVTGETEDYPDSYFTIPLPGGYVSNAKMDVDYVTIVMPDGTIRRYFIPGSKFGTVRYRVDKNGNLVLISDRPMFITTPFGNIPNPAYPWLPPEEFGSSWIGKQKNGKRRWVDIWRDRISDGHPSAERPHPQTVVPSPSRNF